VYPLSHYSELGEIEYIAAVEVKKENQQEVQILQNKKKGEKSSGRLKHQEPPGKIEKNAVLDQHLIDLKAAVPSDEVLHACQFDKVVSYKKKKKELYSHEGPSI
jgi:hypothetical protein